MQSVPAISGSLLKPIDIQPPARVVIVNMISRVFCSSLGEGGSRRSVSFRRKGANLEYGPVRSEVSIVNGNEVLLGRRRENRRGWRWLGDVKEAAFEEIDLEAKIGSRTRESEWRR